MTNEITATGQLQPEALKVSFSIALTRKYGNYQKALDTVRNAYVAEDNLPEAQEWLRNLNAFMQDGDNERKAIKEPYLKQGQLVDAAFKEFIEPFRMAKERLQEKVNTVAQEVTRKQEEKRRALQLENTIKEYINNFILTFSVKIASADTNEHLISIERLINLEKANKSKYGEFLPMLVERCNELNVKIGEQKNIVRQRQDVIKKMAEARKAKDDEALHALVEADSVLTSKMADNTIRVQEQAAAAMMVQRNGTEEMEEIKARRTVWKAELVNLKECIKKQPDMLDFSLNTEKVRDAINTLKSAGALEGKEELIVNGIRYFQSKTF